MGERWKEYMDDRNKIETLMVAKTKLQQELVEFQQINEKNTRGGSVSRKICNLDQD